MPERSSLPSEAIPRLKRRASYCLPTPTHQTTYAAGSPAPALRAVADAIIAARGGCRLLGAQVGEHGEYAAVVVG
jgi:hypothetical protein